MHTPQLVCWLGERDNTFEPDSRIGRIVDFGSWGNSDDASGITFNNGDTAHVDHTRSTLHKPVNSILVNHSSKTYVNLKTWSDRVSDDPDNEYAHPLPILTAAGNDEGGGTYYGSNMFMVGFWSWALLEGMDLGEEQHLREVGYQEIEALFKVCQAPGKESEPDDYLINCEQVAEDMSDLIIQDMAYEPLKLP